MKLFLCLLFIAPYCWAINFGTGAEGNCSDGDFTTARTYNCADVTITGPVTINTGTDPLVILATGQVIIGDLTISAANGSNGTNNSGADLTTAAGVAGGGSGGAYLGTGGQRTGGTGTGARAGAGGIGYPIINPPNPNVNGNGAGGAGAGNGSAGNAGGAGSGSASTPGSTSSDLAGGSGGGAGGAADDGIINTASPGTGGAGGGFLTIHAAQGVILNGTFAANGGNGGTGINNGGVLSGGGGGGAGGTILIRSTGSVNLSNATIQLAGGSGGAGGDGTNNGGNGGVGRLRVETANINDISSSGLTLTAGVTLEKADLFQNTFESKIATGCGSIDLDNDQNFMPTFLMMLFLLLALPTITKIKKHRRH